MINSLLSVWFSMSLVNMLFTKVAQWNVTVLGVVILGNGLILYIVMMNSSVIFVYLELTDQY